MGVPIAAFLRIVDRLPGTHGVESANYTTFKVHDRTFGYLWPVESQGDHLPL